MFALFHVLPSWESEEKYVLLRKIAIIKHKIIKGKRRLLSLRLRKENEGVNEMEKEKEKDGHKNQIQKKYFLPLENERAV